MAAINSTMQALGNSAVRFELPDTRELGGSVSLERLTGRPLLIMFICNHCPYVIHVIEQLVAIGNKYQASGFAVLAISSNDVENYPQDGPDKMSEFAKRYGFEFPYLYDESQSVAKAYGAACTPDFFIYDRQHFLVYRGQMDASRPSNSHAVTGRDLTDALNAVLENQPVNPQQTPSIGCSIKWKAGNQP